MIKIPVPKFVVFYNGEQDQPDEYDMKLSDAFEKKTENPELELVCKVYNINFGKNEQILQKCKVLREYMIFVDYVRYYHKEQEGRQENSKKIAQKMLMANKPVEEIMEFTELSMEELAYLAEKIERSYK